MRKKVIFWMPALILLISAASVNAQVTIGSTADPHGGAVLDLSKASGSSVGFLLPRVSLTNVNTWQIGGVASQGVGMVVYNTNENVAGGDGSGIYVWNGTKWQALTPAPTIKDAEGNEYFIGDFGAAGWWMTQNLRSTKSPDGTNLEQGSTNNNNDKYYAYPNLSELIYNSNTTYGLLYSWAAASGRINVSGADSNGIGTTAGMGAPGICPVGWHLPSDYEWSLLEKEIATNPGNYSSQMTPYVKAGDFKYGETTGWRPGDGNDEDKTLWGCQMKNQTLVNNDQATDGKSNPKTANGFDALLVGYVHGGAVDGYGTAEYFWSSSSNDSSNAWYRSLGYPGSRVYRGNSIKYNMFSVRCKKTDN